MSTRKDVLSINLRICALCFALLIFNFSAIVFADDDDESTQNQISGRVVEISIVGDLFIYLDIDGDGSGDIWAKIQQGEGELLNPDGQLISLSSITVGMNLILTEYDFEGGYYEIHQAIVSEGKLSSNVQLSGIIVVAFEFGESTFVALDFNDDGKEDVSVQVNHSGLITDVGGNVLEPASLEADVLLRVVSHRVNSNGLVITWHVIVGQGEITSASFPLVSGTVVEINELNGVLFVLIESEAGPGPRAQSHGQGGRRSFPIRIGTQTLIQDERQEVLDLEEIHLGDYLEILEYEYIEGYFEAEKVSVTD